jgi:uncharacterized protein (DUF305 family)
MRGTAAILLTLFGLASCRPPIVQPGAPGTATRTIARARAADLSQIRHTAADVRFMQGMIHHPAQALDMTALVPARAGREEMKFIGLRIELSQADEIKMMRRWLESRGEEVPGEHAHHLPGATLMPGMLTPDEMTKLAEVNGPAFDRLFLEFMIKHHEGALIMVDELFSDASAGQDSEIFAFASDVVADQRAEIERMGLILREFR